MFTVTWYERNVKQISTFASKNAAERKAKQLTTDSNKLKRVSFVPIIVAEVKEIEEGTA